MRFLFIALTVLACTACQRFQQKDNQAADDKRIVCISKQYNEIIYALGAEKNLVAVDISSIYPPEIQKLPTVGYHRALSLEAILANKPDLILEEGPETLGPEHVVRQLEQLHIPMQSFHTKAVNIDSTKQLIKEMGQYFHREERVDSLCHKLDADLYVAQQKTKQYTERPKVLVIHFGRASNVYLLMGNQSAAGQLVRWAGGDMAIDAKGMKQISPEVVAQSNPDVILLTDFGYDRLGTKDKISQLPGVSSTKAFQQNRIYRFAENDLVYFGPRTGENVLKLQQIIHGEFDHAQ